MLFVEAEDQAAQGRATLDHLSRPPRSWPSGAGLEARVAELEAWSHHLEANKVKAEDALRKEKRGM